VCSAHQPLNGADSGYVATDEYLLRKYRVLVRHDDARYYVTVPSALGEKDATNQAMEQGREQGIAFEVVRVELAS
jgi:hypothetical protein